ncbi:unnamed protein product, partial [Closterium sp. Naga37s-1]
MALRTAVGTTVSRRRWWQADGLRVVGARAAGACAAGVCAAAARVAGVRSVAARIAVARAGAPLLCALRVRIGPGTTQVSEAHIPLYNGSPESYGSVQEGSVFTFKLRHQHTVSADNRPNTFGSYKQWLEKQTQSRAAVIVRRIRKGAKTSGSRRLQAAGQESTLPLNGGVEQLGTYYVTLQLGSQKESLNTIIDTGSDLLWVRCTGCVNCPRNTRARSFNAQQSTTRQRIDCAECKAINETTCAGPYRAGCGIGCTRLGVRGRCVAGCGPNGTSRCNYAVIYGDGSYTGGVMMRDVLTLPGRPAEISAPVAFGCDFHEAEGLLKDPLIGLIGLGQSPLSIPSQLVHDGVLQGNIISHCLGGEDGGGFITFGPPPMADSSMQFVPMGNDTTVYNATIFGIQVNGVDLQIPADTFSGTGGIIDSGSTALTLPEAAYTPLREAVIQAVDGKAQRLSQEEINQLAGGNVASVLNLCYNVSASDTATLQSAFPTVAIVMDGANLELPPQNYLWLFDNLVCFCVYDSNSVVGQPVTIIG